MKKVLVIVDPQNDFITGSLAVKTASEKMNALVEHLWETKYDAIFVTLDSHPENHCSFECNGGQWPVHCVPMYEGWDVPEDLDKILGMCKTRFAVLISVNKVVPNLVVEARLHKEEKHIPFLYFGLKQNKAAENNINI